MTNPYGVKLPILALAPMDDVTDTVFRQIILECAKPDIYFSEFINVDGLNSPGRQKLYPKLRFSSNENKLIIQLWGKNPDNFFKAAREITDGTIAREIGLANANYIGIDLNMGCPQKKEVASGTCAALMNNRPLADAIIEATKKGLDNKLPLSIKTRLGYSQIDLSWAEFLLSHKLNMLTIHGRTKKEKSNSLVHWKEINEVRRLRDKISPETLIIGNGDVESRLDALNKVKEYKLDGAMIGRGVFADPYVFARSSPWFKMTPKEKLSLYAKHIDLYITTWPLGQYNLPKLNKFCKTYINGFAGAKTLREKLMHCKNMPELKNMINEIFKQLPQNA